jgi:two-component system, chemotaxis family, chemotaxis protein CheY
MALNILVVDDSSIVRKAFRKTLEMTSIAVDGLLEAGNGKEALDLLEEHWVDVVFLDINMPVMDGREFMRELRKRGEYADLPVIIVSTEGSDEAQNELRRLRISGYLRKPVTPELLVAAVNSIVGGGASV